MSVNRSSFVSQKVVVGAALGVGLFSAQAMGDLMSIDDFSSGVINPSHWQVNTTGTGENTGVSVQDGRMHIFSDPNDTAIATLQMPGDTPYFTLNDVSGAVRLAFDFETTSVATRPYGIGITVLNDEGTNRAEVLNSRLGSSMGQIFVEDGVSGGGNTWLERDFRDVRLHAELELTASTFNVKFYMFDENATSPSDYTDTQADLNAVDPGSLLADITVTRAAPFSLDEQLRLNFSATRSSGGGASEMYVDNVYANVPEPGSMALIGCGALAIFGRRNQRRQA